MLHFNHGIANVSPRPSAGLALLLVLGFAACDLRDESFVLEPTLFVEAGPARLDGTNVIVPLEVALESSALDDTRAVKVSLRTNPGSLGSAVDANGGITLRPDVVDSGARRWSANVDLTLPLGRMARVVVAFANSQEVFDVVPDQAPVEDLTLTGSKRVGHETTEECRLVELQLGHAGVPQGDIVALQTTVGSFVVGGSDRKVMFIVADGTNESSPVSYRLPKGGTDAASIAFQAVTTRGTLATLELPIEPLRPTAQGTLVPEFDTVAVGPAGSSAMQLLGRFEPPSPGAAFTPQTEVIVEATFTANGGELGCSPLTSPEFVPCAVTSEDAQSCADAKRVTIGQDGRFSLTIRANICQSGVLTVTARTPAFAPQQSSDLCIGEWPPDDKEAVATVEIELVASPAP